MAICIALAATMEQCACQAVSNSSYSISIIQRTSNGVTTQILNLKSFPFNQVNDSMCVETHGNQSHQCIHEGITSFNRLIPNLESWYFVWQFGNCFILVQYLFFFRSTHEVAEIDNYLFALGGNDGSSSLNSVEKYDTQLNKWTIVSSMVTRRSSIGAAVLECFNLERGLVQTTNLWHLTSIPENATATTTPSLSSSVPNT